MLRCFSVFSSFAAATVHVHIQSRCVVCLSLTSDEGVDSEPVHKVVVLLLGAGEELGHEVELRVNLSPRVQQRLGHRYGRVVAVVQSETVEYPCHCL